MATNLLLLFLDWTIKNSQKMQKTAKMVVFRNFWLFLMLHYFFKNKSTVQLLLMLKTRSKRPKLKTDLSLRIRGVCQDSTLTHEIFDNYCFGSKRLEKHYSPTSN